MKKLKRFAAACLTAAVACANVTAYADEVIGTAAEPLTLEVYCPGANDDPEFPFNFDVDVDSGSISYIDLEEPVYGFDRLLDGEALDFDVRFSLKDEYKDFDHYEFQVFNADYTEDVASGYFTSDEVFTIPGLEVGTGYKISMALVSEQLTAYYAGSFVIQAELDSTLSVDLFYGLADIDGEAAVYAVREENDVTNGNRNTPDRLVNSSTMVGTISQNDEDYFIIHIPKNTDDDGNDIGGVGELTLSIRTRTNEKIKFEFFNESFKSGSGEMIDVVYSPLTTNKIGTYNIRIPNLATYTDYLIKVSGSSNSNGTEYRITPQIKMGLAWYGQYVSKDGDTVYWNTNKLNEVYSGDFPIFMEGKTNPEDHVFTTGCGIAAAAMIFKNLGATMDGYDLRTGKDGTLQADPYTALLANIKDDGRGWASETKIPTTLLADDFHEQLIGVNFGFKDYMESITVSEAELQKAISKYGYVLIYLKNLPGKRYGHFMLLTGIEENNSATKKSFAERAIVCDPAGKNYSTGAGIPLANTISGYSSYDINDIKSARCFVK